MPKVRVLSSNFMDMVANLPAAKLHRLYDSHWTCQAIFRSLPPVAKMYVLRLLYVEAAISSKLMQDWALTDSSVKHKVAVDRLEQLRVILQVSERKKEPSYRLNAKFQQQLRRTITKSDLPREPISASIAVRLPTPAELDSFAMKQWEAVLLQLVSSSFSDSPSEPQISFIINIFQRSGLVTSKGNESSRLTESGFQFLLMDTSSQLWLIVREYISASEDRGMDGSDLIGFLFELGFHVVGEPYSINGLKPTEQRVLEELAVLGLVRIQQGMKDRWFIPTKLIANLATSLSEASSRHQNEGFIVVETNFRIYAYTSSKLQTEILRFFIRVEYVLPNLIVGALTKETACAAFASGITADQIISFLQQHAHPHVAKRVPSVPETVSDQIRLWESDSNRVMYTPACLYDDFPSMEVFEAVCAYSRDIGGLLWHDSPGRRLIVRGDLHEDVRNFIRRQSTNPSQKK